MRRRDTLVPEAQLADVITALYDDAHAQDWVHMSPGDRSRAYSAWVDNDRVGGVLTRYMTPEAARAWIKDGPMKEYGRAIRGTGRYARFGRTGGTSADDIISTALGAGWQVIAGTEGVKPFHAEAESQDGQTAYVVWDESRNFKNLVWAALRASVESAAPAHIVVTEPPGATTSPDLVDLQRTIAKRCNLHLHYVREQFGSRQS